MKNQKCNNKGKNEENTNIRSEAESEERIINAVEN